MGKSKSIDGYVAEEIMITLDGDCALDTILPVVLCCHLWSRRNKCLPTTSGYLNLKNSTWKSTPILVFKSPRLRKLLCLFTLSKWSSSYVLKSFFSQR